MSPSEKTNQAGILPMGNITPYPSWPGLLECSLVFVCDDLLLNSLSQSLVFAIVLLQKGAWCSPSRQSLPADVCWVLISAAPREYQGKDLMYIEVRWMVWQLAAWTELWPLCHVAGHHQHTGVSGTTMSSMTHVDILQELLLSRFWAPETRLTGLWQLQFASQTFLLLCCWRLKDFPCRFSHYRVLGGSKVRGSLR